MENFIARAALVKARADLAVDQIEKSQRKSGRIPGDGDGDGIAYEGRSKGARAVRPAAAKSIAAAGLKIHEHNGKTIAGAAFADGSGGLRAKKELEKNGWAVNSAKWDPRKQNVWTMTHSSGQKATVIAASRQGKRANGSTYETSTIEMSFDN